MKVTTKKKLAKASKPAPAAKAHQKAEPAQKAGTANEAPKPSENLKTNERKWTKRLLRGGWTVIPNIFFERQNVLGLDPLDINIILHLAGYWWTADGKPRPSKVTIAKAIGVDPRTVQRRLARLESDKFIQRISQRSSALGSRPNLYDLSGLIQAATPYADEKVKENAAKAELKAARAGRKGKARVPEDDFI